MTIREIVLDTETTGLDPDAGHRIVEIACVELVNHLPTGRTFQRYLNPERDMPTDAQAVHGLTTEFLAGQPLFRAVADEFLEFIGDAPLVAHNAAFDQGFINAELARLGREAAAADRFVDTLLIARKRFPGASCSLDALAKRFQLDRYGFDLAARKSAGGHGALVDARILAEVYLQLKGGREQRLAFDTVEAANDDIARPVQYIRRNPRPTPLPSRETAEEAAAHAAFVATLGPNAIWLKTGS